MRISDWSSDVCSSDLKQARADHPRRPEMRLVRQNETQRPDDMRRRAQQNLAFPQRLAHEAELVVLEIAQTAMDELRTRRRSRRAEVVLLAQQDTQATARRVARDPGAIDAAPDDQQVVVVVRHRLPPSCCAGAHYRSDEHTSELPSLMR